MLFTRKREAYFFNRYSPSLFLKKISNMLFVKQKKVERLIALVFSIHFSL